MLTRDVATTTPQQALRKLFETLFLRGRSARGVNLSAASHSISQRLSLVLGLYALLGLMALIFMKQPVMQVSLFLHGLTLAMVGSLIASSSGELLFNKAEDEILLHRPIEPRVLLWAKVSVLMKISLLMSAALNGVGFVVGVNASDGGWAFVLAHAISTTMVTLFCVGAVISLYQFVLRFFGRERLESLMTTVQVLLAIFTFLAFQLMPRMMGDEGAVMSVDLNSWWLYLLPPAWFAGIDDMIAGSGASASTNMALIGIVTTALLSWIGFIKLAHAYGSGMQALGEARPVREKEGQRRWFHVIVTLPPLNLWLRNSVARASFILVAAYLTRDREIKLRVYPAIAPLMIMPVIPFISEVFRESERLGGGEVLVFAAAYVGMIPLSVFPLISHSQQWQAADIFHAAPLAGPAQIQHGARRAVLTILVFPCIVAFAVAGLLLGIPVTRFDYLLPGIILIPVYAVLSQGPSTPIPFSSGTDATGDAAWGCLKFPLVMGVAALISVAAVVARGRGLLWLLILVELAIAIPLYLRFRSRVSGTKWKSLE